MALNRHSFHNSYLTFCWVNFKVFTTLGTRYCLISATRGNIVYRYRHQRYKMQILELTLAIRYIDVYRWIATPLHLKDFPVVEGLICSKVTTNQHLDTPSWLSSSLWVNVFKSDGVFLLESLTFCWHSVADNKGNLFFLFYTGMLQGAMFKPVLSEARNQVPSWLASTLQL